MINIRRPISGRPAQEHGQKSESVRRLLLVRLRRVRGAAQHTRRQVEHDDVQLDQRPSDRAAPQPRREAHQRGRGGAFQTGQETLPVVPKQK